MEGTEAGRRILENIEAGQSLLEVCLNHGIDVQHKCGGVCSCTTCHVYIEKGEEFLEEKSRREKDFLNKVDKSQPNSRLSCQCLLMEGSGEIQLMVSKQKEL
jgi:2Fe-2S ferredoxin